MIFRLMAEQTNEECIVHNAGTVQIDWLGGECLANLRTCGDAVFTMSKSRRWKRTRLALTMLENMMCSVRLIVMHVEMA